MKNIRTRIISILCALVMCLSIFPVTSYAETKALKITGFRNLGTIDMMTYNDKNGVLGYIIADKVVVSSLVEFDDETTTFVSLYGNSDFVYGENNNEYIIDRKKTSDYTLELGMYKDEYNRYKKEELGIYNVYVYCYDVDGKLFGSYSTAVRIADYKDILGQPKTGNVCEKSQYLYDYEDNMKSITCIYYEVDKETVLPIGFGKFFFDSYVCIYKETDGCLENEYYLDGMKYNVFQIKFEPGKYLIMSEIEHTRNSMVSIGEKASLVKASSVAIPSTLALTVGDNSYLSDSMTILPTTCTQKASWASDNTAVATVAANGKVTAVTEGTANITVTVGDVSAKCLVTVTKAAVAETPVATTTTTSLEKQTIKVNTKKAKLSKKKTIDLTKCVTINDKAKVTYAKKSGNKLITVSEKGKLTVKKGLKKGTYKVKVKISAAATDKYEAASVTKTFKIKVK